MLMDMSLVGTRRSYIRVDDSGVSFGGGLWGMRPHPMAYIGGVCRRRSPKVMRWGTEQGL